jgi:hypothetical protein
MGTFIYGVHGLEVQIDDRTLAHLRAVICGKLRKREPFCFTAPDQSQGQVSFWIDSSIPVAFRFDGEPDSQLNQAWLVRLTASANCPVGLRVLSEPAATLRRVDAVAGLRRL